MFVNVQDIIIVTDIILDNIDTTDGCQIKDSDLNQDRLVNINDIILMITLILGN